MSNSQISFIQIIFLIIFIFSSFIVCIVDDVSARNKAQLIIEFHWSKYNVDNSVLEDKETWTPLLFELLEKEKTSFSQTKAIVWLARFQLPELLTFYEQNLESICSKPSLTLDEYWQLSALLEAVVFLDNEPDEELLFKGLSYYLQKVPMPKRDLEVWWGGIVTAFYCVFPASLP
jgi:hypothetical protein